MKIKLKKIAWKNYFLGKFLDMNLQSKMNDTFFKLIFDYEFINIEIFHKVYIYRN